MKLPELESPVTCVDADGAGAEPDDSDADDNAQYWTAALKLADRCALSLMPLQSEAFPQMPPSVSFDGARMHAPCANLCARLESAPPAA